MVAALAEVSSRIVVVGWVLKPHRWLVESSQSSTTLTAFMSRLLRVLNALHSLQRTLITSPNTWLLIGIMWRGMPGILICGILRRQVVQVPNLLLHLLHGGARVLGIVLVLAHVVGPVVRRVVPLETFRTCTFVFRRRCWCNLDARKDNTRVLQGVIICWRKNRVFLLAHQPFLSLAVFCTCQHFLEGLPRLRIVVDSLVERLLTLEVYRLKILQVSATSAVGFVFRGRFTGFRRREYSVCGV